MKERLLIHNDEDGRDIAYFLKPQEFDLWLKDGSIRPGDYVYEITIHSRRVVRIKTEMVLDEVVEEAQEMAPTEV